jgi:hypothetical protein
LKKALDEMIIWGGEIAAGSLQKALHSFQSAGSGMPADGNP